MSNRLLLILTLQLLVAISLLAQPNHPYTSDANTHLLYHFDVSMPDCLWSKTIYDDEDPVHINEALQLSNGDILLAASLRVEDVENKTILSKMALDGDLEWDRRYRGYAAFDVEKDNDGNLILLAADTSFFGEEGNNYYLIFCDEDGDSLASILSVIEVNGKGFFNELCLSENDGYVLGGAFYTANFSRFWSQIASISAELELEWTQSIDARISYNIDLINGLDDGYIFCDMRSDAPFLTKFAYDSTIEWSVERQYGGFSSFSSVNKIYGNYLSCGSDGYIGDSYCWVDVVDQDGEEIWSKLLPGENNNDAIGAITTIDGNILVFGESGYTINDGYERVNGDVGLFKLDKDGEIIWQSSIETGADAINLIDGFQLSDGSYNIIIETLDENGNNPKPLLIRTTPDLSLITDVSVNQHYGSIIGSAESATGKWGDALHLPYNEGGAMIVADDSSLHADELTIECWFRMDSSVAHTGTILRKIIDVDYASFEISADNSVNEVVFQLLTDEDDSFVSLETDLSHGAWHHVAATYDGAQMQLFVDGTASEAVDLTGAILYDDSPLVIGANSDQLYPEFQFYGDIDELRISNIARTDLGVFDDLRAPRVSDFFLSPPYPNPFNSTTTVNYGLPHASDVTIQLYDLSGRMIRALVDAHQTAGVYSLNINSSNIPSGHYFLKLQTGQETLSQELTLIK